MLYFNGEFQNCVILIAFHQQKIFINLPGVNPVFESGGGYSSRSFVGGTSPFDKHLNS